MRTHLYRVVRLSAAAVLVLSVPSVSRGQINPVARWVFAGEAVEEQAFGDEVHGCRAEIHGTVDFMDEPLAALMLDGEGGFLSVTDPPAALLPSGSLSVEAWVSLNAGQSWGGLVGYFQDNGSFEKGWLLGYNPTKFTFSVSTEGKLQYLPSRTEFEPGQWYHVVGTYDGSLLQLYINGKLENSQRLRGTVDYPEHASFTIGAYKDDNEFFPMNGSLHEVAVYTGPLSAGQIKESYGKKAPPRVVPWHLELGPYVQYVTPSEAVVYWWTTEACSSILEYGLAGPGAKHSPGIALHGPHQGALNRRLEDQWPKERHAMKIEDLNPDEVYAYRVKVQEGDTERSTDAYELDTALNYSVRPLPPDVRLSQDEEHNTRMRAVAKEILQHTGVTKGYCLVWGVVDGALTYELAANSDLTVVGVDEDAARVAEVRDRLYKAGVYGTRITVQPVERLADLPYPSGFANLIASERMLVDGECPGQAAEMHRVLRPRAGAAVFCCPRGPDGRVAPVEDWLGASSIDFEKRPASTGVFHVVQKQSSPGIGSWTHQYGDAGNTADSHDDLGGASGTDDLRVQWLGKPGADFGMDRNPRMPAPLAANGRLFHQGMNRMVALDAYNGTILWSLEVPALQRVNLPRDASNWCTDDAFLYVAIKDKCWRLEHYNGGLERVFDLPEGFPGHEYDWGYVARKDGILFGSAVAKNTVYTDFWGGDAWYDKTAGYGTEKVCSDALFSYDPDTKTLLWVRRQGLIINTTIAIGKQSVFFVESRSDKLKEAQARRLNDPLLWSEQYLVSLDPRTGQPVWEAPLDTADGIVVFFLACTDDAVVIASSAAGKYHLYAFDPQTGTQRWHASHNWTGNNHSGHMQHPVVLADRVFLEPCGYDLRTGALITSAMGRHEGCATYCGTAHALLYRGQSRRVALWDFNTGKVTSWHHLRPSCWLSTIAAEGMVLSPEGGGGCSCGNWLETSLAFASIERRPMTAATGHRDSTETGR